MIDLHTHSNASDGQYPPDKLMELARFAGIDVIALTDHDTVSGLEAAERAASANNVGFINGVEISCSGCKSLHILGLGIDRCAPELLDFLEHVRKLRDLRNQRLEAFLHEKGVNVTTEMAGRYASDDNVRRPHFALAMVEMGYAQSVQDAFERYLGSTEYNALRIRKPPAEECISKISHAGGYAVLAHPCLTELDDSRLEALVSRLKTAGLSGLECYYPLHSREQTEKYLALAVKLDLFVTAGSDYHGERVKPDISIGTALDRLPQKLQARVILP